VPELVARLDARDEEVRLLAIAALRELERTGRLKLRIGPALPSYDHIHTTASYGYAAPGVCSVARMVWAAHEAGVYSTLMIEHESVAHLGEAERAVAIVNRGMATPLRLVLGVEFKAPIDLNEVDARAFSTQLASATGQGEAAWAVGVGAKPSAELKQLVQQFQAGKSKRAAKQLDRLNRHLSLMPPLALSAVAGPDGNITDRQLCLAVAKAKWPGTDDLTLVEDAGAIRKLLNPGGPGHVPYPRTLPSYQDLIGRLLALGLLPTFTAQLRSHALATCLPLLQAWGIQGLDVAGIEPDEPDAEREIQAFIKLAQEHKLALFGGSDYRGTGTGWSRHAKWMDHPLMRATITRLADAATSGVHALPFRQREHA
jgi:hypothetical protein